MERFYLNNKIIFVSERKGLHAPSHSHSRPAGHRPGARRVHTVTVRRNFMLAKFKKAKSFAHGTGFFWFGRSFRGRSWKCATGFPKKFC